MGQRCPGLAGAGRRGGRGATNARARSSPAGGVRRAAMWSAAQSEFADALIDAERSVPPILTSHTTRTPTRRFAVYRNNVVFSLIGALRTRFPVVERIVGVECFAA